MLNNSSDLQDIIFDDYVYKVTANSDLVVHRKVQLYNDKFFTYHDYTKDKNDKKLWLLANRCELIPKNAADIVSQIKCIRPSGKWTITATVTGSGQEVNLYMFTLNWPTSWAAKGYTTFTFGFTSREAAEHCHKCFAGALDGLKSRSHNRKSTKQSFGSINLETSEDSTALRTVETSEETHSEKTGIKANAVFVSSITMEEGNNTDPESASDNEDNSHKKCSPKRVNPSFVPVSEVWVPLKQQNGVAVYHHRQTDDSTGVGGEYMVSAVVRGCPRICRDALLSTSPNLTILGPALDIQQVSCHPDGDREILRITLEAQGLASYLYAPRQMLIERVLKHDDAGLYCILFSPANEEYTSYLAPDLSDNICTFSACFASMNHGDEAALREAARKHADGGDDSGGSGGAKDAYTGSKPKSFFKKPVKGMVRGGYTIAPLLDHQLDSSPESLITCIIKVDLGGACGESSWLKPMSDLAGFTDAFLDRILMAVTLVRDAVEHRRFQLQPHTFVESGGSPSGRDNIVHPSRSKTAQEYKENEDVRAKLQRRRQSVLLDASFPQSVEPNASGRAAESFPRVPMLEAETMAPLDYEAIQRLSTLDPQFWEGLHQPGKAAPFKVRGPTYLKDRKKIEAGKSMFVLGSMDVIIEGETPIEHIARFLPAVRLGGIPFAVIIHLVIPGSPLLGIVATFVSDYHPSELGAPPVHPMDEEHDWSPFDFVLHKYINSDNKTRDIMLKLIPHIADGSWMIKQSVGTTPVILGKLKTTYHVTPQYIEVDIDISANTVANYVTGLVRGATKSLVIDMGFVLEGTTPWELPEALVGALRLNHLDLKFGKTLDTSAELPLVPPKNRPGRTTGGGHSRQVSHAEPPGPAAARADSKRMQNSSF